MYSSFYLANDSGGGTANARIYINGAAVGTEHSSGDATYAEKTDAVLTVERGDLIQMYLKGVALTNDHAAIVRGWVLRSTFGEDVHFAIQPILFEEYEA